MSWWGGIQGKAVLIPEDDGFPQSAGVDGNAQQKHHRRCGGQQAGYSGPFPLPGVAVHRGRLRGFFCCLLPPGRKLWDRKGAFRLESLIFLKNPAQGFGFHGIKPGQSAVRQTTIGHWDTSVYNKIHPPSGGRNGSGKGTFPPGGRTKFPPNLTFSVFAYNFRGIPTKTSWYYPSRGQPKPNLKDLPGMKPNERRLQKGRKQL